MQYLTFQFREKNQMTELPSIIPIILYFSVGMISLTMAFKNIRANEFLPFHQKAAGKNWKDLDDTIRLIILALMKVSGLGFLILSILLIVFPAVGSFYPNKFFKYAVPAIALLYCSGLIIINYSWRSWRTTRRENRCRASTPSAQKLIPVPEASYKK